jgi:hypothetical protein
MSPLRGLKSLLVLCGAAEGAGEKVEEADPSRAKLYPNERKKALVGGSLFARSG